MCGLIHFGEVDGTKKTKKSIENACCKLILLYICIPERVLTCKGVL